jgi:hypothetical protein
LIAGGASQDSGVFSDLEELIGGVLMSLREIRANCKSTPGGKIYWYQIKPKEMQLPAWSPSQPMLSKIGLMRLAK